MLLNKEEIKIAVLGLGYVGLPLAISLAKVFKVVGFDINKKRVEELQTGEDSTGEISSSILKSTALTISYNEEYLSDCNLFIVTVPTPINNENLPDLEPLKNASKTIAGNIKKNSIVVYESTVYPGVTEDVCAPVLENYSGLKVGEDIFLGYSPERINPGDKQNTIENVVKVISGQNEFVVETLKYVYGKLNNNKIFVAKNIKTAEASKVIENTQRDINIAFINEIALIAKNLKLSVYDILEAASTKWNFLNFLPGLVGGHCIGVDPYYLAYCAKELGVSSEVTLAGRSINESMAYHISDMILAEISKLGLTDNRNCKLLVLGITFKENVPDLRNTKVSILINNLKKAGLTVDVHDPVADVEESKYNFDIDLNTNSLDKLKGYDCIIGAVAHKGYRELSKFAFEEMVNKGGLIVDIKNIWKIEDVPEGVYYWTL